jgi:hypothetical protein
MSPAVPAGIAVLGAGAATFGAALGLELARASAEDDALNAEFQVDAAEHLATMEDLQLGARIAVGVGSGLVLAGGVMLVVGLASGGAEAPEMGDVSAACSGDGCAFGWRGSF